MFRVNSTLPAPITTIRVTRPSVLPDRCWSGSTESFAHVARWRPALSLAPATVRRGKGGGRIRYDRPIHTERMADGSKDRVPAGRSGPLGARRSSGRGVLLRRGGSFDRGGHQSRGTAGA